MTPSPARARFRRGCAAAVGVLPGPLSRVVAPSLVGFAVVNGFTFAVDLLLLSLLIDGLGLPLWAGVSLAYGTAFALSFVLNRWLNFDPERPVGAQIGRYVAVIAVNYAGIVLGVTHGLAAAGVPYQLARLAAGACEAVFMYCAMRWFVFGRGAQAPTLGSCCPGSTCATTSPPPPPCGRCCRGPRSTSTPSSSG